MSGKKVYLRPLPVRGKSVVYNLKSVCNRNISLTYPDFSNIAINKEFTHLQ